MDVKLQHSFFTFTNEIMQKRIPQTSTEEGRKLRQEMSVKIRKQQKTDRFKQIRGLDGTDEFLYTNHILVFRT